MTAVTAPPLVDCVVGAMRHGLLVHCNAMPFLKVIALTVVCIVSSCKPHFKAWSALSLPGIPVCASIPLKVGPCVNLNVASLMALVIVFKSSFLLFSMFTAVCVYCNLVISCFTGVL